MSYCPYCGHKMLGERRKTRDHILPKSRGGPDEASNIIDVCQPCNQDKANMTIGEWYGALLAVDDPRSSVISALVDAACDAGFMDLICGDAGAGYARKKRKIRSAAAERANTITKAHRRSVERENVARLAMHELGVSCEKWAFEMPTLTVVLNSRPVRFNVRAGDVQGLVERVRMELLRTERDRVDARPKKFVSVWDRALEMQAGHP